MVDVGGFKLSATIRGQGKPVVVFEHGLKNDQKIWDNVRALIAEQTQTITYDRAGIGVSEVSKNPRCPEQFAEELHALLQKAELTPPYILVSHGTGDMTVRHFFAKYPTEVAGLVIIDGLGYDPGKLPGFAEEEACWHEANAIELLRSSTTWPDVPAVVVTLAKRATHPRIQIWLDKLPKVGQEVSQISEGWAPYDDSATVARAILKVLDAVRR
jgi:pimeloyl-ACP methyl ester carboxylesterase